MASSSRKLHKGMLKPVHTLLPPNHAGCSHGCACVPLAVPDSAPHSPTPTAHALTPEQSMGRAGSVGFTFATGFRAAGHSGPCRRSTASRRAAVGWHVLSACKHEFLSPRPWHPAVQSLVHLLTTPFTVPSCAYLPAAAGRAVTQSHAHLLTLTCFIPAPCGVLPALYWWIGQVPGAGLSS